MTSPNIEYPILLIKPNKNEVYGYSKDLGLISKGGDSFYRLPIKLVDRVGKVFKVNGATNIGKASLLDSVRYFQPMQRIKFELELQETLTFDVLKKMVLNHIKQKPKPWLALGTFEMIKEWTNEKKSIPELIKMFR